MKKHTLQRVWWDAINDASHHDLDALMCIYLDAINDYCNDY